MLTTTGRRVRAGISALVLILLLVGTFWGEDDNFPFGPYRMYSTRNEPNGTINAVKLRGINEFGEEFDIPTKTLGLRPAEINGQITRFEDDSLLASHLAESYHRFNPDKPPLVQLEVIHTIYEFEGGKPVSSSELVRGTWERS